TDDDLAAVLLLQTQRLLERIGVGLVHLEAGVGLANPGLLVVQAGLPLARGHLLDADRSFHRVIEVLGHLVIGLVHADTRLSNDPMTRSHALRSYFWNSSAALVPPKPNEFDSAYVMRTGRLLCGT